MSGRFKYIISFGFAIVMLAGLFQSCKHDPVSPPPPPACDTCQRTDTTKYVLRIAPDSVQTPVLRSVTFTASLGPRTFQKPYKLEWKIDGTLQERVNNDTISTQFANPGSHAVHVTWLDSAGKARASDSTIAIVSAAHTSNDTSSHAFTWTEYTNVNGENNMTGCWVFGPKDIWAINGDLHYFDGTTWTRIVVHDNSGQSYEYGLSGCSIFAFSDNDMWFTYGGLTLHYIGGGLVERYDLTVLSASRAWFHSAWGTSSSDMFFVGDSGTILHFDGANWTKFPAVTGKALYSISGTSSNIVWAAGYNTSTGESEVLHFDGSLWSKDVLSTSGTAHQYGIGDVFSCDSDGHRFVTTAGDMLFRKTDDGPWRQDNVPNGDNIGFGIRGNSANDLLAVGGWGLVAHWSGKSWMRYEEFFAPGATGYGATGAYFKDNTACVVGVKNGTSWVLVGQRK